MTNTKKIGSKKAATMTESQIKAAVFRGAGSNELRGLSDVIDPVNESDLWYNDAGDLMEGPCPKHLRLARGAA